MAQVTPSTPTTPVAITHGTSVRIHLKNGEISPTWYQLKDGCSIYDSRCIPLNDEITKNLLGMSFIPGTPVEFEGFTLLDAYN